jgi:hypothetical protein
MTVDPVSDIGAVHFSHITNLVEMPGFVKSGSVPTPEEVEDLPKTSFADMDNRKYPVHTKTACWLSYAYFKLQEHQLEKSAADRINRAFKRHGSFWNIGEDLDSLESKINGMKAVPEKQASEAEEDYALNIAHDGKQYRLFPIDRPAVLLKSASELVETRSKLTYGMRKQAATNIMLAAESQGVSLDVLPQEVHSMAGFGVSSKQAAVNEIDRRCNMARKPSEKQASTPLATLRDAVATQPDVLSQEFCEKVAAALDMYDRFINVTDEYGKSLQFPEDVLFGFTKHSAEKMSTQVVSLINGSTYWLSDLEKSGAAVRVLGEDIFDAISDIDGTVDLNKVSEVLPTLPRGDAAVLDKALAAQGIPQVALDKTAAVNHALGVAVTQTPTTAEPQMKETKRTRALAVKVARAKKTVAKLKEEAKDNQKPPRNPRGKFINKAPNSEKSVLVKEDK